MMLSRVLIGALAGIAFALTTAVLPASQGTIGAAPANAAAGQSMTIYIFGGSQKIMGPDGKPHDTVVPANFVVKAGTPVTVTVINYDEGPHSITAPDLKLDATIKGGHEVGTKVEPVSTTFTFTPTKKGNFRWYCKLPCDAKHNYWAMSQGFGGPGQEGYMAGEIVVL